MIKKAKKFVKEEEKDLKEIFTRLKKKDFTGNTGLIIKNSIYQLSSSISAKIGSLIFTIILARLLMPELFGLYSLALSTILIFSAFSSFGIGDSLVTFISSALGKGKNKLAKSYLVHLGKIKILLLFISIIILLLSAKFISVEYYKKPLFLALVAGALYILFSEIINFLGSILQASNYFEGLLYKEIAFQISRIILVPLIVIFSLKNQMSNEMTLFYIFLMLALSYLVAIIFMLLTSKNKINFIKSKSEKLEKNKKKKLNNFFWITSIFILSGVFFSLIDRIMLGAFISSEPIGYYSAAFSLISAIASLVGFGGVMLPVFTRVTKKAMKKGFRKSLQIVFLTSFVLFILTLLFANLGILIAYGSAYSQATNLLRILSPLIILIPLIGVYSAYFMSIKKPKKPVIWLVISTIINIILNYILITILLKKGEIMAVYGAIFATLISQVVFLTGLIFSKK